MSETYQPTKTECGWVKLFTPRGPQVTIPVTVNGPEDMMAFVHSFLDAGWLVQAPGLEAGEEKETFHHVVKEIVNDTTHISLYRDNDAFRYLGVYLNRPEDEQAFELASGLKLSNLPEYVGVGHIERRKSASLDKFVITAPKPFSAVWKHNPKHDPDSEEGKKKPKRLFVRWADVSTVKEEPKQEDPESIIGKVKARLATEPDLPTINSMTSYWMKQPQENPDRETVINAIHKYASSKQWQWENDQGKYVFI